MPNQYCQADMKIKIMVQFLGDIFLRKKAMISNALLRVGLIEDLVV